jgi:ATP-binding cassette subfamily F protein 3
MRLLLAKLLLKRPSLLLLDEPTNHLDLDSLTWLEDFLLGYQGSMVIISHDRSFLDRVTSITWELSLGRLSVFRGNYSHYLVEKAQRLELERAAYDNQQAQIRQSERFITRFRAKSTKAKQVQSRVRQLEKLERIELSETDRPFIFPFRRPRLRAATCCIWSMSPRATTPPRSLTASTFRSSVATSWPWSGLTAPVKPL